MLPGPGASVSNVLSSVQSYIPRPTANDPVGVGSVISLLRSSQSNSNDTAIPRTPTIANAAIALNIRRASERGLLTDEVCIRTSGVSGNTKYFV